MCRKLFLFGFLLMLSAGSKAQKIASIKDFNFLKGSWSMNNPKGRIVELWKLNNESLMEGVSYSINTQGDSTLLETIKLFETAGNIYYVPSGNGIGNDSTVSFKLISSNQGTFVFENPDHDFPQRISYKLQSVNNLLAWIEGTVNGKFRKVEFPYNREKAN